VAVRHGRHLIGQPGQLVGRRLELEPDRALDLARALTGREAAPGGRRRYRLRGARPGHGLKIGRRLAARAGLKIGRRLAASTGPGVLRNRHRTASATRAAPVIAAVRRSRQRGNEDKRQEDPADHGRRGEHPPGGAPCKGEPDADRSAGGPRSRAYRAGFGRETRLNPCAQLLREPPVGLGRVRLQRQRKLLQLARERIVMSCGAGAQRVVDCGHVALDRCRAGVALTHDMPLAAS
jgi:hypothetical protein